MKRNLTLNDIVSKERFEELQELFGKPVDIVRLRNNMNPMLLKQIKRDGIYV